MYNLEGVNIDKSKNSEIKTIEDEIIIANAICKIKTFEGIGTGFFIELKKQNKIIYCLMTNEHVITQQMIANKIIVEIKYNNQNYSLFIKLDKNERYIQDFLYLGIDATIVEILYKDNIQKDYFNKYFLLPNYDYLRGYDIFINQNIYVFQYPLGEKLSKSEGIIKEVNEYKNQMSHLAKTLIGSSGSPIIIRGTKTVLGIHKQKNKKEKENYANFIGPIINALECDIKIEKLIFENYYEGELKYNQIKEGYGRLIFKNGEIYIGQFHNDKYNGKGVLYYKKNKEKYEGNFLEGKYDGKGKLVEENGDYYIGYFKNGKKNGFGEEYYNNKTLKYSGEFKDNLYNGSGKRIYSDGSYYIGFWLNGIRYSDGKIYINDKILYEGFFINEIIKGKIYSNNGQYYEGEIKNYKMNGKGTIYYNNKKIKYSGIFVNNCLEGEGIFYDIDGNYYIGNFKNGMKHGKGAAYNKDNNLLYEGDFKENKFDGNGRLSLKNGKTYIGEFKNGKMEGQGIILDRNNIIVYEGEFENDHEKIGYLEKNGGKIKLKIDEIKKEDKNKIIEEINNINENFDLNNIFGEDECNTNKIIKKYINGKIKKNEEYKKIKGFAVFKEKEFNYGGEKGYFNFKIENNITFIGNGEFINGKFTGKVKLLDENNELIYEGDYLNDQEHGFGTCVYINGNFYTGEFKYGKRDGKGILYDKNKKIIYEGEYKNDKKDGNGKLYLDYEDKNYGYYIGEFKEGKITGKGKVCGIHDNLILEGYFIDFKLEGKGKEVYNNLDYFEGEFKNGKPNGKGKIFRRDMSLKYEGDFINGKYEGQGRLIYDDGNIYFGEFKDGIEKGQGILVDKNSNILYEGEFDGKKGIGFYAKMAIYKIKNIFGKNK